MFFKSKEAMHALGVPTTRSVALVASKSERVLRAWYKNASSAISAGTHNPDEFISGDHMEEVRERTFPPILPPILPPSFTVSPPVLSPLC